MSDYQPIDQQSIESMFIALLMAHDFESLTLHQASKMYQLLRLALGTDRVETAVRDAYRERVQLDQG